MALSKDDFFLPKGELNENWFPEIDEQQFVTNRLNDAQNDSRFDESKHDHLTADEAEDAREAYVYEKAYRHIYRRKADDPSSWSVDQEGSEQQTDRQVERWRELAEEKQDEWTAITERPDPDDQTPPTTSVSTPSSYV